MPHNNLPLCSASIDGESPPSKDRCRKIESESESQNACVSDTTHLDFQATIMFPILRVDFRFCFPKLISTAIRSISMARSIDVHQMIENQ